MSYKAFYFSRKSLIKVNFLLFTLENCFVYVTSISSNLLIGNGIS